MWECVWVGTRGEGVGTSSRTQKSKTALRYSTHTHPPGLPYRRLSFSVTAIRVRPLPGQRKAIMHVHSSGTPTATHPIKPERSSPSRSGSWRRVQGAAAALVGSVGQHDEIWRLCRDEFYSWTGLPILL